MLIFIFFFQQKTAYDVRISDWISDVCSSDLFNAEQIDGLPEGRFPVPERIFTNRDARDPVLDEAFAAYGVPIRERGSEAYYSSESDCITMPPFDSFTSGNAFYATLAHEAVHSTGHRTRLDRETLHKYHDQVAIRAKEEMIRSEEHTYELQSLMRNS